MLLDPGSRCRLRRWARTAIAATLLPTVAGCASGAGHPADGLSRIAVPPLGARPGLPDAGDEARDGAPERDAPQGSPALAVGRGVVRAALRYIGTPYRWGGTTPTGFDCSGFVKYVYARLGILLPRTVRDQYHVGEPVPRDRLRVGDIVFFDRLRHNGIYIGGNRVIHASRVSRSVRIARLDEEWFSQRWVGARRPRPEPDAPHTVSTTPSE